MDNIQELFPAWEDADKDAGIVLDTFAETVRKQAQAKNALMGQMQKCINNAIANGPEKIRNKEFSAASGLTLFYGLPLDAALDGGMFEMLQADPNNAGVVYSIVTALCLGTDSPYSFLTCAFITKRKLPSGRPYAYIDGRWTRYFMIEEDTGVVDCTRCPDRASCEQYNQTIMEERRIRQAVREVRKIPGVHQVMEKYGTKFYVTPESES